MKKFNYFTCGVVLASLVWGCQPKPAEVVKTSEEKVDGSGEWTTTGVASGMDQAPSAPGEVIEMPKADVEANAEADLAWKAVLKACEPPGIPEDWGADGGTAEQREEFMKSSSVLALAAADLAKGFYERFPNHPMVSEAKNRELEMLETSMQLGMENLEGRLAALNEVFAKEDPEYGEMMAFQAKVQTIEQEAMKLQDQGFDAVIQAYEKGVASLAEAFPKRAEVYQLMVGLAGNLESDRAKPLIEKIMQSEFAEPEVKEIAKGMMARFDRLGSALDLDFTAVDGQEVSLAKLKGKVVLVDFWATWCGPCIAELPNVKKAYADLHGKGFEIVGISLDQNKQKLTQFVEKEQMTWPQYFDGLGWGNEIAQRFGINSIPAMWLVDKKGVLRDINARADLVSKVEKLLAETD